MVRALVTLLGAAGALALLYLAPVVDEELGNGLWGVALATAGAGFALGLLYQAGGVRRPGVRLNAWLLVLVALPWTLLSIGLVAQMTDAGSNIASWTRDVVPASVLARWVTLVPAFALASGLLVALGVLEPRVGRRETVTPVAPADERFVAGPAGDPLDVTPGTAETFRPTAVPVTGTPGSWGDEVEGDTAATRVTPGSSRPRPARDEATAVLPPERRSGEAGSDADRTVVIRPGDETDPDVGARRP